MNVSTTCPRCKKEMVLRVSQPGYERWRTGELIQNCALGLSDVDLERLLSGYCPPCWDLAFTDDVSKSAPPVDDESPF